MDINYGFLALASSLLGVLSHLIWFIRGEHVINASRYFIAATCGPSLVAPALWYYLDLTIVQAILTTAVSYASYFASLFASISIYRLYFHPLRHFPGPPEARLTQFWHVSRVIDNIENFRHLDRMHTR